MLRVNTTLICNHFFLLHRLLSLLERESYRDRNKNRSDRLLLIFDHPWAISMRNCDCILNHCNQSLLTIPKKIFLWVEKLLFFHVDV